MDPVTETPDSLTGRQLPARVGRYQVHELLGQGGMARVFRAELFGSGGFRKQCALKVIHRSIVGNDPGVRQLLLNEARLGGLLKHPNVVDTYDCGEIDGQPYIAMELIRGRGLDELIEEEGALPPDIALGIAVQMCAALDHAHGLEEEGRPAELVHRDLKPSNAMLSRDGLVKLMDFGIAKATIVSGATTKTGMTKGTPQYMSPEQISGKPLDRRSDLFALGAILFELLTGQRLFQAENIGAIVLKIVTADTALDNDGRLQGLAAISGGLEGVIRTCVRVDPDGRFSDALTLRQELKGLGLPFADSEDLKAWVRDRMEDPGTTTADVPSVVGPAPDRALSYAETTPLPMPTQPATLEQPGPPEPIGPTRPMPARRRAGRLPLAMAALGVALLLGGLVWVLLGRQQGGTQVERTAELDEGESGQASVGSQDDTREAPADEPDAAIEALAAPVEEPIATPTPPAPTPAERSVAPDPTPRATPQPSVAQPTAPSLAAAEPRVEPTPAPPALSLKARTLPTSQRRTQSAHFEVLVDGSPDATATLLYRLEESGPWSNLDFRAAGQGVMRVSLPLRPDMAGMRIRYYVVARDGAQAQEIGSRDHPRFLDVL